MLSGKIRSPHVPKVLLGPAGAWCSLIEPVGQGGEDRKYLQVGLQLASPSRRAVFEVGPVIFRKLTASGFH